MWTEWTQWTLFFPSTHREGDQCPFVIPANAGTWTFSPSPMGRGVGERVYGVTRVAP